MSEQHVRSAPARESALPWRCGGGGPAWGTSSPFLPRRVRPAPQDRLAVADLLERVREDDGEEVPRLRFLPALERLVSSLDTEAGLHAEGRAAVRRELVEALVRQRQLVRLLRDHPVIALTDIRAPVFVTGLPGSGAALLHNLLAEHPGLDAPALWELADPGTELADVRQRLAAMRRARAEAEEAARSTLGRGTGQLLRHTRPGGCHRLLANAFHSMTATLTWRVPGYGAWLEEADLTEAYAFHRAQVQAITWRIPGSLLVLRDPFHSRHLRALLHAYPDARIVHVHRSPADVVGACAGISAARRLRTAPVGDPGAVGTEWTERVERHFAASEQARSALPRARLLDVRHAELVADPVRQVRRVQRFAGVTPTPLADRAVAELAARSSRAARAARPFRPEEFGLSRRRLDGRFAVYRTTYGV
ncbi:sulfotransferase [Streptomyces sp. JHA26]|uniref:sulfotransferase family protein n=1 Tax=Streptomyces sp. JHA26 TaxID=1917143 RepID=UPI00098BCD99|nr:sulfotransferase [Streptomyces sp. JHA26]